MNTVPFVVSDVQSNLEYIRLADPSSLPVYLEKIHQAEERVQNIKEYYQNPHAAEVVQHIALMGSVKEVFQKSGISVLVEDSFNSHSSLVRELRHYYSNERDISIEGKYEVIGDHCFEHCPNIETLRFEEGVEQINGHLFSPNKHLRRVEFPHSLRTIGFFAFGECFALETVTFKNPNTRLNPASFENTIWFTSFTDEFVVINKQLLKYQGNSKTVSIPNGIAEIGFRVFSENETIQTLICPLSLEEIDTAAFSDCPNLCRVNLNEGLKIIGGMAFNNCPRLQQVTLPESLQILCCEAFYRYIELHYSSNNFSLAKHIEETYPYAVRIAGPKWNWQAIDDLYALCNRPAVDLNAVEQYIVEHRMTSDDITYVATQLAADNTNEIVEFEYRHERTPLPEELSTYSFVPLFELFAMHGLKPNTIIRNERNYENMIFDIRYVQNKGVAPAVMRILMEHGGDPNLVMDHEHFFDDLDFSVIFDVVELNNKDWFDNEFRVWLVAMAYGRSCSNGRLPVRMKEGYSVDIFKNFERFDYRIEWLEKDWIMHIIDKQSGEDVAILE